MYDALELALRDREVEAVYLLSDGAPTGKHHATNDMLRAVDADLSGVWFDQPQNQSQQRRFSTSAGPQQYMRPLALKI